jgi:uncharacterized membrane protein (DUF2068 family)
MDGAKRREHDEGDAQERHGQPDVGLKIIAIGKLIKVIALVSVGIAALAAAHGNPPALLVDAANALGVDPNGRHMHRVVEKLSGVPAKKLDEIGFGSFVYAALFAVEGIGLWMQKRWAEYLTLVITTSFIPLELYELVKHVSPAKVATLIFNVAVVVYLLVRVLTARGRRPAPARLGTASH